MVEKGREDWEQGDGGVVDILGHAFNLQESTDTEGKDTDLQVSERRLLALTWFRLDTLPSFRFSTIFSMSSAALSKNCRRPALTISGPDFITVLEKSDSRHTIFAF